MGELKTYISKLDNLLVGILKSLVDRIIKLDFVLIGGEFKRILIVRKMKRINHSTLIPPFEITKKGIKILNIGYIIL